jgi:hypothetical protein
VSYIGFAMIIFPKVRVQIYTIVVALSCSVDFLLTVVEHIAPLAAS